MPQVRFGVNVNSRAVLLLQDYTIDRLMELAKMAEDQGYHSLWVGDSLFTKPRLEPIVTLSLLAGITKRVKIGTCSLNFPLRDPLLLAQAWSTLDVISKGRTILGVGTGTGSPDLPVTKEYELLRLLYRQRTRRLEEGIELLRLLWAGKRTVYNGRIYNLDCPSLQPRPVQSPCPPIYMVAYPWRKKGVTQEVVERMMKRVARLADGWMIDGGAKVDQFSDGLALIERFLPDYGKSISDFDTCFHITGMIHDDRAKAEGEASWFIQQYYGELRGLSEYWGPMGPPSDWVHRIEEFIKSGLRLFVLRFAAKNQLGQLDRFTRDVLPSFR